MISANHHWSAAPATEDLQNQKAVTMNCEEKGKLKMNRRGFAKTLSLSTLMHRIGVWTGFVALGGFLFALPSVSVGILSVLNRV